MPQAQSPSRLLKMQATSGKGIGMTLALMLLGFGSGYWMSVISVSTSAYIRPLPCTLTSEPGLSSRMAPLSAKPRLVPPRPLEIAPTPSRTTPSAQARYGEPSSPTQINTATILQFFIFHPQKTRCRRRSEDVPPCQIDSSHSARDFDILGIRRTTPPGRKVEAESGRMNLKGSASAICANGSEFDD